MSPLRSLSLLTAAAGLLSCAYYNGLYNANRLADAAARAEREGRSGEAGSLWSQVAVKAESVVTRYPDSRYRDDALLLQGLALQAAGHCDEATVPLEEARRSSDRDVRGQAAVLLGECRFALGEYGRAISVLDSLVTGRDTAWSASARLWRGKSLFRSGAYVMALADLESSGSQDAAFDLAMAYALTGKSVYARAALEGRVEGPYVEQAWLEALDTLGTHHPADAAELVDSLLTRNDLTGGERARLLLRDAHRWSAAGDLPMAAQRLARAARAAGDSTDGRMAALEFWLLRVRLANELRELGLIADSLERAASLVRSEVPSAARMSESLRAVANTLESMESGGTGRPESQQQHVDLDAFLAAEQLRDRFHAPSLAGAMFRMMAVRFPTSTIAPKALVAAAQLEPQLSDSLLLVVHTAYATSPYTMMLRGVGADRYEAIEDSLRLLTATRRYPRPRDN